MTPPNIKPLPMQPKMPSILKVEIKSTTTTETPKVTGMSTGLIAISCIPVYTAASLLI